MTKDEAIIKSLVKPNKYGVPSMITVKRAKVAMDLYSDYKLSKVSYIHSIPIDELKDKIISHLYSGGADAIVDFIKINNR